MKEGQYAEELSRCVRCGACKSLCPTYLSSLDETMGARGRIAMLGALIKDELPPSKDLSDRIFSCILCERCKDMCPTGINIPEAIYHGRTDLRRYYKRARLLRTILRLSFSRMQSMFALLRAIQRPLSPLLYKVGKARYIPKIASRPFMERTQVYRGNKRIGRVGMFVGCSVNYLLPHLGDLLLNILIRKGFEVVALKGEVCCGAPMRSMGLEREAIILAKKNIELFNKMRTDAILSICPTCTMVIKRHYPVLAGDTIDKIMDINEFFIKQNIVDNIKNIHRIITYHDPCHLRYGLGIKDEPRELLRRIKGIELIEMEDGGECCGFGGLFSINFKELSNDIGRRKITNIHGSGADTVITSCPGCMIQLEDLKRQTGSDINIMHILELIAQSMDIEV
jgi:glycolate oxidase iron-sulfur subunit